LVNGERDSTNVPGQALFLMNHPGILSAATRYRFWILSLCNFFEYYIGWCLHRFRRSA
jgi:hypothetical protein